MDYAIQHQTRLDGAAIVDLDADHLLGSVAPVPRCAGSRSASHVQDALVFAPYPVEENGPVAIVVVDRVRHGRRILTFRRCGGRQVLARGRQDVMVVTGMARVNAAVRQ
jgi:hypothetical protein